MSLADKIKGREMRPLAQYLSLDLLKIYTQPAHKQIVPDRCELNSRNL